LAPESEVVSASESESEPEWVSVSAVELEAVLVASESALDSGFLW
jgi:hypothetical protein